MKRLLTLLPALLLTFSLVACGGGGGESGGKSEAPGNTDPPEGYDAEYTIVIDGSDSWTPFENSSGVTFASSKGGVISTTDDGKTVKFTGLAVGETDITATSGTDTAKALVKVVKRSENQTGESDPPEEAEKHYLTYNVPITAYSYVLNGGSGSPPDGKITYYENKRHLEGNYSGGDWWLHHTSSNGIYTWAINGKWETEMSEIVDRWDEEKSLFYEWPLSNFAEKIANMGVDDDGQPTGQISNFPIYELRTTEPNRLPNKQDVTKFYLRSEEVCGVLCDVYELPTDGFQRTSTYWVDPSTGWTLKYEEYENTTKERIAYNCYEVTDFTIGSPAWSSFDSNPH